MEPGLVAPQLLAQVAIQLLVGFRFLVSPRLVHRYLLVHQCENVVEQLGNWLGKKLHGARLAACVATQERSSCSARLARARRTLFFQLAGQRRYLYGSDANVVP